MHQDISKNNNKERKPKSLLVAVVDLSRYAILEKWRRKGKNLSFPPKGGGVLRLPRAFSAALTGRFGMGTVRMAAEGRW
jgi:hypothetical protein